MGIQKMHIKIYTIACAVLLTFMGWAVPVGAQNSEQAPGGADDFGESIASSSDGALCATYVASIAISDTGHFAGDVIDDPSDAEKRALGWIQYEVTWWPRAYLLCLQEVSLVNQADDCVGGIGGIVADWADAVAFLVYIVGEEPFGTPNYIDDVVLGIADPISYRVVCIINDTPGGEGLLEDICEIANEVIPTCDHLYDIDFSEGTPV